MFDITIQKLHIAAPIAKHLLVKWFMPARHGELFFGHIHTDHFARLTHELGQHVNITPRAAAEIEYRQAFEMLRQHQSATVIPHQHFIMHSGQQRLDIFRQTGIGAAGIGLQIMVAG